ncbi:replication initiation protein [Caminibacter sp.]
MAKHIEVKGDLEVKKADIIIRARYKLNPLSLKFITALIAGLKRGDDVNELYIFKVNDFKELTGLKRKDLYWAVKEAVKELLEKPIYIPKGNEGDNSFLMLNWVSSAEYKEGEGFVEFEISKKLRPYLLEAQKKFLKYRLENILPLKSSYVIRLYEILKDWLELNARYGNKAEKIVSVDEFREMLEIPKSYQYSSGIKLRILEKAKKEFEKHTDILFDYDELKTGRKVTHLKFIIRPNPAKLQTDNGVQEAYFKTPKAFIEFLRRYYAGTGKAFGFGKRENVGFVWFGIDKDGLLYSFKQKDCEMEYFDFNSVESMDIYRKFFKLAQNSELYRELLKQNEDMRVLKKESPELFDVLAQEFMNILKGSNK